MASRTRTTAAQHITVRLPIDLDTRIRALIEQLTAHSVQPVTVSYVLGEVVRLGLPVFERRMRRK